MLSCFIVAALMQSGCVNLSQDYPAIHTYTLAVSSEPSSDHAWDNVIVDRFSIAPLFRGKEFIYKETDNRYDHDYYHTFTTRPEELFASLCAQYLGVPSRIEQGFIDLQETPLSVITAHINALYCDLARARGAQAVISMTLRIDTEQSLKQTRVFERAYESAQPLTSTGALALVQAWEKALEEILQRFREDAQTIVQA